MTNIVLIDLSSIAHPIYHTTVDDPNPNAMSIAVLDRVRGLAHGQPQVAVACDSKRSVRKEADPSYKANRPKEDRAALYHQLGIVVDALKAEGFPLWSVDGYEADDVIASATMKALAEPGVTVQIVSADKDLLALVGPRVTLKSLRDGSAIDEAAVLAKFGVKPEQVPDYLALVGDQSDNVKGASKIGPVTAVKLLSTHGSLEAMYAAWTSTPTVFTPAVYESLKEFWPRVDDVLNLIRLHDDLPIPFEEIAVERKTPMFDTPSDFAFDADPTGLPAPAPVADPYAADRAVSRAQAEATVEAQWAPPPAPTPAPAPAPPRRRRVVAVVPESQAAAFTPPAVTQTTTAGPVPLVQTVTGTEPAPPPEQSHVHAKPAPVVEEQRRKQPDAQANGPQQALVPQVIEQDYSRQLEPRSMSEAITLAKYAMDSRLFGAYGSAQSILMTIIAGRELGMATMHALRAFHVIDGKPVLAADAIRALVMRSGLVEYLRCTERSESRATFAIKRKGDPEVVLSYTIEEARAGGLVKAGSGWLKNPADMLVARAGSKICRLVCPDVIHGIYAPEEME